MQSNGQFVKGRTETKEAKLYRIEKMTEAWANRADYIKDIKDPKFYNVWRSFKFTEKGKRIGCSQKWNNYRRFYKDMFPTFIAGKRLVRIDKSKWFSKGNCVWATEEEAANLKGNNILIDYKGETRTIKEWAYFLNKPVTSIRNRYHKYSNILSTKEILLGKKRKPKKKITSAKDLSKQLVRNKASKMCSQYKNKDSRKGDKNNITKEWLIDNILFKPCIYCGSIEKIGCDRINNSKGHTTNNVVPCCIACNTVRNNNFSHKEMFLLGQIIKKIMEKRT